MLGPPSIGLATPTATVPFVTAATMLYGTFATATLLKRFGKFCFPRLKGQFEDPLFLLFASSSLTSSSSGKAALFSAGLLMDALYVSRAAIIHSPHHQAPLESLVRGRLRQLARAGGVLRRRILHVTRTDLRDL